MPVKVSGKISTTFLSKIFLSIEHILSLEDGKKRYIQAVTELSKAFSIAIPHSKLPRT